MSEPGDVQSWDAAPAPILSPSPTYRSSADGRLVSYSRPCPDVGVDAFLAQGQGRERFFWEDVRDSITFAGFGAAAHLIAWGGERVRHIQEQARALFADAALLNKLAAAEAPLVAAPRLFGGFAFRADFAPDYAWSAFHPAHFILPHYQYVRTDEGAWLTINAMIGPDDDAEETLPELREALEARYTLLREAPAAAGDERDAWGRHGAPQQERYPLSYEAWAEQIAAAKEQFASGALQKVVLSRVAELRFEQRVDVDGALRFLNQYYQESYRFLFEPQPHHAFFGATPELLAKVEGATITSMAMAGSIRRSQNGREDAALGQELLNSAKDRYEHNLVVMAILERLAPLTGQLEISPQPGVYKLRNIQHLFTPVRGRLIAPDGILPLVDLLHPTPALGGTPRAEAMAFIRQTEPVTRGWYAAPVGWIDYRLDGAFAVAIRSAVSQQRRVWLYAGSGIVADSEPEKEWQETALKFRPMLEALGVAQTAPDEA